MGGGGGGAWSPAEIFVGGGRASLKKAPYKVKKGPHTVKRPLTW